VRPLDPADPGAGYAVETVRTGRLLRRERRTFTAREVVFSAAALGTQRLLHRQRDRGTLPNISPRLGELSRSNSESINGPRARAKDADFSRGVAITSSIHPDAVTHIEAVRYGKGSNLLMLMTSVLVDVKPGQPRLVGALAELGRHWRDWHRMFSPRRWSQQAIVVLTMQTIDNSLTTFTKRGLFGRRMTTKQGIGEPNPAWIPVANQVTRRIAEKIDGVPMGAMTDLVNRPLTAHFIGGCPIGDSPATGVVDAYQRLYGHPGLHVVDGSVVSANLGVNPSLTITAQAERAMAFWPNKGESDPRPPLGEAYRRIDPVPPQAPVVPAQAPGALRLPWPTVQG
jgi:cholesterol oxidase